MARLGRSSRTKGVLVLTAMVLFIIVICVVVSFITTKWFTQNKSAWEFDITHDHQWLHEELALTRAEMDAVDGFENEYRSQRNILTKEFYLRTAELRELLIDKDDYVPEVDVAIHRIHETHGKLQELSIQHYYDMLNVLPVEKQEKLRQLAVKALSQPE